MALHTYLERLKYVDHLIKRRATGNLTTLSEKLNLSRSHTVEFLGQMKAHGFPIKYDRKVGCCIYTEDGGLVRNLFQSNKIQNENGLSKNELEKISGGKIISPIFLHADYIRMSDGNFIFLTH